MERADYCIIGGGIVGLATAWQLLRKEPDASLVLLEAAPALASHQTGHNSGVIHSGIYYAPESLKVRFIPSTGIVDYQEVARKVAGLITAAGGRVHTGARVTSIVEHAGHVEVGTDRDLPFLGVHLTPTIDGGITVGPNAVLGLSREGYAKFSVHPKDVARYLRFPGLWHVARSNAATAVREVRNSLFKGSYLQKCRKYAPGLAKEDLLPREAGIRAQAVRRDGTLLHDFLLAGTDRMLHVLNAPSPAATAALPIGEHLAAKAALRRAA
ncbi:FAD-dependent oxidoreductase [Arthrobacter sp. MMS24-T111]